MSRESRISIIFGAVFILATSAIGPAFLTQTAVFTEKFLANFAFAILASILIDIAIQLNVWRIIAVTKMRGQEIGDNRRTASLAFGVVGGQSIQQHRLVVRSNNTFTYQAISRSNFFHRKTTGCSFISLTPFRIRALSSSRELTRICRRKLRAILEKAHSIRFSQEPCFGV